MKHIDFFEFWKHFFQFVVQQRKYRYVLLFYYPVFMFTHDSLDVQVDPLNGPCTLYSASPLSAGGYMENP